LDFDARSLLSSRRIYKLGDLLDLMDDFIHYAIAIECHTGQAPSAMLDELDEIITIHAAGKNWSADVSQHPIIALPRPGKLLEAFDLTFWIEWSNWENSFLALAISCGLEIYPKQKLESNPSLVSEKKGRPLLSYALHRSRDEEPCVKHPSVELTRIMLEQGASPNQMFGGSSVWGNFLSDFHSYASTYACGEWLEAARLLIRYGASKKAYAVREEVWGGRVRAFTERISAIGVFEAGLPRKEALELASLLERSPEGVGGSLTNRSVDRSLNAEEMSASNEKIGSHVEVADERKLTGQQRRRRSRIVANIGKLLSVKNVR
jgi:hypothetical protein